MPSNKRKPKDDEQSITSEGKQPIKNVPALMGEGEKFFRDQLYAKATECYTEALELSPGNINALVERASCYLKTGKYELALADAEESLKENKEFTKGLYQKAESLYGMGEFELALVFYHRGKKLRGDVKEFQLGINKAQEAIDNCVGDPNSVKLEVKGDLSYFDKPDENKKKQQKIGYQKPFAQKQQAIAKREKRATKPGSQKTIKQLLGELYADKIYLESLLQDDHATRANTKTGDAIWGLANNGLDFLDSRTEFWRQQKPVYARKQAKSDPDSKNPLNYILKQLEVVDNLQSNGKHSESLDKSNKLMIYVNKLSESQLSDKKALVSNIYSNIGNAHLEMGKYDNALQAHQKDLEISKETENREGISRAYENIGRVYARNGKYKDAIDVWERKLPFAETNMEKAWLYHEIGRCHLETGDYETAKDYGHKSLEFSEKIDDEVWQMNATVLIAQSEAKIGNVESLNSAIENFDRAIEMADKQNDQGAGKAIKKAQNECKEKLKKLQIDSPRDDKSQTNDDNKSTAEATPRSEANSISKNPSPTKSSHSPVPDSKSPTKGNESPAKSNSQSPTKGIQSPSKSNSQSPTKGNQSPVKGDQSPTKSNSQSPTKGDQSPIKSNAPSPTKGNDSPRKAGKGSPTEPQETKPAKGSIDYEIQVRTASDTNSGTDANVFISLFGTSGEFTDLELKNSSKTLFEAGSLDKFEFNQLKDIGKLNRIKIGHDGNTSGSSWKIESIKIIYNNVLYQFDANKWLDDDYKKEGEKLISVELLPTKTEQDVIIYEIDVKTANEMNAGTDAKVKLGLFGSNGEILDIALTYPSNNKNPFEKNALDKFEFNMKNIGKINKISIKSNGEGLGSSWKLDYIKISVDKQVYNFTANRWIEEAKVELSVDGEKAEKAPNSSQAEYNVTAVTANKLGAGTDSAVSIIIYGDKGETEKIQLKESTTNKNPFEKGKTDKFVLNALNVGDIKKINISHDGVGIGNGWFCDKIEVKNLATNSTKNFPVGRWLDSEEGDGKIAIDLVPDVKPAQ